VRSAIGRLPFALACMTLIGPAAAAQRPRCTVTLSPGDDVQRALDGAAAASRPPVVCLRPGEFRLRRFVAIGRDGTVLRGEGPATVLALEQGVESPVVVVGDWEHETPGRPTANVTIEDLRIVGGGREGGEALADRPYLTNSAVVVRAGRNVTIRKTVLTACRSACILTERDTRRISVEHDDVSGSVWDGIALNRTSQARIVANMIHDNGAAGISTEHLKDSLVADNVVADNRTHGIYLSDSYHDTIARNRFVRNVLSGIFLACAVRQREPPVRCWNDSMSAGNVFERNRFVGNRVGYMVGADAAAGCRRRGFTANRSRGDAFARNPRADPRATAFGRCLVFGAPR